MEMNKNVPKFPTYRGPTYRGYIVSAVFINGQTGHLPRAYFFLMRRIFTHCTLHFYINIYYTILARFACYVQ